MIDFIRASNQDDSHSLLDFVEADIFASYCSASMELSRHRAYENTLVVKKDRIEGSVHKAFNMMRGNLYSNSNDFSYSELETTLDILANKYHITTEQLKLSALEFGYNFEDFETNVFINNNLQFYKGARPHEWHDSKTKTYKFFKYTNYKLKFYNKASQLGFTSDILRTELHLKSKEFNRYGIIYLEDLLDKEKLYDLHLDYLQRIENCLIIDSLDFTEEYSLDFMRVQNGKTGKDNYSTKSRSLRNLHYNSIAKNQINRKKELIERANSKFEKLIQC